MIDYRNVTATLDQNALRNEEQFLLQKNRYNVCIKRITLDVETLLENIQLNNSDWQKFQIKFDYVIYANVEIISYVKLFNVPFELSDNKQIQVLGIAFEGKQLGELK